ncbi:TolC family protein [Suttonella ornithocola]|uniref:Type I secretion outer membrane protein, TolC family n=1 Tax=Suttonella ornithocola TaxID=279832 RepID=A0A380MRU6_9GAMM|nr:TolC family protein [Suttonella ornithocola]SUO95320.1 type I secretion outer membrane protein, TolC family [Suttonella ornithocola]
MRAVIWAILPVLVLTGCVTLKENGPEDKPSASFVANPAIPLDEQKALLLALEVNDSKVTLPQPLDYVTAMQYVKQHSHALAAERAALRAQELQAEALNDLHQSMIFTSANAGRYHLAADVGTAELRNRLIATGTSLNEALGLLAGQLSPNVASALGHLPSAQAMAERLPEHISVSKSDNFSRASVGALLPLYTGGKIDAVQSFAKGRADVQRGKVLETESQLLRLLAERYFLVQLAKSAVAVREDALDAVKAHDHAAQRMLDLGLIAKVERLQGATALADAKYQLEKAKDDLRLAERALAALLEGKAIFPVSALFVDHRPLPSLEVFQTKALAQYPAFAKIAAKREQAKAMKRLSDSAWKPTVAAFGLHEVKRHSPDWVVGVTAQWTINSPVNRRKMQEAAEQSLTQVDLVEEQAIRDVKLLVEKEWLAVNDARARFDSLAEQVKLAKEVVRLRNAGFKEGLNTVIELNDAEANLAKVRTERAQAAYQYVVALAGLLEASGEDEQLATYLAEADTHIDEASW